MAPKERWQIGGIGGAKILYLWRQNSVLAWRKLSYSTRTIFLDCYWRGTSNQLVGWNLYESTVTKWKELIKRQQRGALCAFKRKLPYDVGRPYDPLRLCPWAEKLIAKLTPQR